MNWLNGSGNFYFNGGSLPFFRFTFLTSIKKMDGILNF